MGIKPLITLKSFKTDGDEGNNFNEDDINDSDSEDKESNDMFDDAQIRIGVVEILALTVRYL